MVGVRRAGVRVKVCGITNQGDAVEAVHAGADGLGFVFYRKSPRYITPRAARQIIKGVPARILKVGVFVDADPARVRRIARSCGLGALQFHGRETPAYCKRFRRYMVIKAFCVRRPADAQNALRYTVDALLFDSWSPGRGGSGKSFDWRIVTAMRPSGRLLFLAGGLTARTVGAAIRLTHPDWIDVSSSLESRPGRKDRKKMKAFIREAKQSVNNR